MLCADPVTGEVTHRLPMLPIATPVPSRREARAALADLRDVVWHDLLKHPKARAALEVLVRYVEMR